MGLCYSTGFTSLLTSPAFTKSIDTVEDFIEAGLIELLEFRKQDVIPLLLLFSDLYFGGIYIEEELIENLNMTGIHSYKELALRQRLNADRGEQSRCLKTGKFAIFTKLLSQDYVTEVEWAKDFSRTFRPMRSCIFTYYTVFAFEKHSVYTKLFSQYIQVYKQQLPT